MTIESHGHEHELEPQYGLPERLPESERILWQGSPQVGELARSAFHLHKLVIYFGVLIGLRGATVLADGGSLAEAAWALLLPTALAGIGLMAVGLLAWLTARTAVYTLTDRRVVMRIGIVLTLTFNLPLRMVESAALRPGQRGHGDIVLRLKGPDRIAWLHLWPHARPWCLTRPEPMLRAVPEAAVVAARLTSAWSASTGVAVEPSATAGAGAGTGSGNHPPAGRLQPGLT